jgi:putative transcriptional regulator
MIVHHDRQGAVGIVLNRGFPHEASALMQHIAGSEQSKRRGLLHFGGPHSGPVLAVHNCGDFAEYQSAEGVYLAAQIHNVRALVSTPDDACNVKIMVGQADWKAGELDREFKQGYWLPLPVTPQLVFADEQQMWPIAMRRVGDHYLADMTGAILPKNVLLN